MDTTGTKDFVLYSEVSFAQGAVVDHIPLTIVATYAVDHEISCIDDRSNGIYPLDNN